MAVVVLPDGVTHFDWTVPQGSLRKLQIPVLSGGQPYPVNGWAVTANVKDVEGGDLLHAWSSGDVLVAGAFVTLTVLPATSLAWSWSRGWWRCEIAHPVDVTQIYCIVQGKFAVSAR